VSLTVASWPALGSTATVIAETSVLADARAEVEHELAAIDAACSRFRPDSELTRVNRAAGRVVAVGPLLAEAIATALRVAAATDGLVDPTVGRALVLAGYDRDYAQLRPSSVPLRAVAAAGWRTVAFDPRAGTVRVPASVALDLGASAKALAADRAAACAARRVGGGVLVNLGGDVAVAGEPPAGGWRVHVCEDHRAGPDAPGQTIRIHGGAVATSSTTTRRWRRAGRELHHILNPASGQPAAGAWRTVSVAATSCVDANAAATAAIVRGSDALRWLERLRLPARLVAADGAVVTTGAWPDRQAVAA
jgi:thiamine biosynthesis lipoprotein